jgi:DNA-3-methyladenine glycosylase
MPRAPVPGPPVPGSPFPSSPLPSSPSPGTLPPGLPPPGAPPLPREFFARPAQDAARDLLGCVLRHDTADGAVAVMLTEVEAYAGTADAASHAFRGRTSRNAVMFGEPGHAYVYFTYGMHFCVNLVCLPAGTASAVLLRAGRVIEGASLAAARRSAAGQPNVPGPEGGADGAGRAGRAGRGTGMSWAEAAASGQRDLARGPARLCQALGIDRSLDGADVCDPASPLRISGRVADMPAVRSGPRVGVRLAAGIPWRFWITGEPTVSPYRAHAPRRR